MLLESDSTDKYFNHPLDVKDIPWRYIHLKGVLLPLTSVRRDTPLRMTRLARRPLKGGIPSWRKGGSG
jgi:hypothetical protein